MPDYVISDGELCHYGVVGMKWGVRRATAKRNANERLKKKALAYDKKAAKLIKTSEKVHAKEDLERSNRKAVKAAKLEAKAANLSKKAVKTTSEFKRAKLERSSENLKFKAAKAKKEADRISKTKGYSAKAMKYTIKSDTMAIKAAKARKKIANNEYYIQKMNRKVSTLSTEEIQNGYAFVNELLKK